MLKVHFTKTKPLVILIVSILLISTNQQLFSQKNLCKEILKYGVFDESVSIKELSEQNIFKTYVKSKITTKEYGADIDLSFFDRGGSANHKNAIDEYISNDFSFDGLSNKNNTYLKRANVKLAEEYRRCLEPIEAGVTFIVIWHPENPEFISLELTAYGSSKPVEIDEIIVSSDYIKPKRPEDTKNISVTNSTKSITYEVVNWDSVEKSVTFTISNSTLDIVGSNSRVLNLKGLEMLVYKYTVTASNGVKFNHELGLIIDNNERLKGIRQLKIDKKSAGSIETFLVKQFNPTGKKYFTYVAGRSDSEYEGTSKWQISDDLQTISGNGINSKTNKKTFLINGYLHRRVKL